MRADLQTYRSAASASIKGLFFQLALTLATFAYSFWGKDSAASSGAVFMGVGLIAWLALAIVYDQHRRERIEAMENDALSSSPMGGTSVFESREDFRPAAARLASLYKWLFPIASILCGLLLVGLGIMRFLASKQMIDIQFVQPTKSGWALGLGITFAALGFVVARYAAGLAKQPVWANLRAGAAFAVGSSLIWLAIAIGHMVQFIGTDAVVRLLPLIIPVFMAVIGAEILLQFLLTMYRPRGTGELPRAAFESRLLGFAAAPDRIAQSISDAINYQLGFDVTSGWAFRLLSRSVAPLILAGVFVTWLMSAVVVVRPHQRAMILRYGNPQPGRDDLGPGWHFKWMWPIESAYVPEYFTRDTRGRYHLVDRTVTGLRRVELGTLPPATAEPILWTNDHLGEEVWQYVRISDDARGSGLADIAAVSVEIPMQFSISNVYLYDLLGAPEVRDDHIRSVARREVTRFFQAYTLDDILGGDRAALSGKLRQSVQAALDNMNPDEGGKPRGSGVQIAFLGITGAHPPKETAADFETPIQAAQRREANISAAETDALERLTEAAGDAATARLIVAEIDTLERLREQRGTGDRDANARSIVEQEIKVQTLLRNAGGEAATSLAVAGADRWNKHMSARALASRYTGQVALWEASPDLYRTTKFFDAFRESIRDARLYVVSDSVEQLNGVLDLKDVNLGVDVFTPKNDN